MIEGDNRSFAVLGLGRFGFSIIQTLAQYDVDILGCDIDEARIHEATDCATQLKQIDLSDEVALKSLGLGNFDVVILAMGEQFETTLIAAMIAREQGAGRVIAKASNMRQKKILESIGVDEVVLPEHEMGVKTARRIVSSNILEILEESERYTISEMRPMHEWIGKTVREADIRKRHGITILAIKRGDTLDIPVSPDDRIDEKDILLIFSENN